MLQKTLISASSLVGWLPQTRVKGSGFRFVVQCMMYILRSVVVQWTFALVILVNLKWNMHAVIFCMATSGMR
jgi:hypothetical protein